MQFETWARLSLTYWFSDLNVAESSMSARISKMYRLVAEAAPAVVSAVAETWVRSVRSIVCEFRVDDMDTKPIGWC